MKSVEHILIVVSGEGEVSPLAAISASPQYAATPSFRFYRSFLCAHLNVIFSHVLFSMIKGAAFWIFLVGRMGLRPARP